MKSLQIIFRFSLLLLSVGAFKNTFPSPVINDNSLEVINHPPPGITNITICNNQLPYLWNGINCLNAGSYTATLTGSNGGDSTAILNLSVINVGTSITNAIICDNQLPYNWNGNNYTTGGTYSVTLTSTTGCDSVPILSLTVNHIVTSTTNRSICSNQLPYNWNGNNYPAAGTYSVILISTAGCDSIATLNLTVKPVSSSTTNMQVCSNHLPYNWNGHSYSTAGTYPLILVAANGCDSIASLNLSITPVVTSITRVTVCSNQLPYSWNGNNYSSTGTFLVTFTGSSGCDSIANLVLTVMPVITSTTNTTICTAQLPYSWNGNSYPAAGVYTVTLTGSSGCDSIAKLNLTVVPFLSNSTTQSVCNSSLPYIWNGISYTTGGIYSASLISAAGCDSIVTLNLTVETPHTGIDTSIICNEQLPYTWHGFIFTAAGTYAIVPPVVLDACNSIGTFELQVHNVVPGTTNATVCSNHLPYVWNGVNYMAAGTYTLSLTSGTGCDSLVTLNLAVGNVGASVTNTTICSNAIPYTWNGNTYNNTGTYTTALISSSGCDSMATLNLTVNPVRSSMSNVIICNAQLPYTWNGNNYNSSGNYSVTLSTSSGCDSIPILNLLVEPFLTSITTVNLCNNQLPFNWNGNNYNLPGVYTDTLTGSANCDSVATLNLLVNPVITSTTNLSICTAQLPFNWNGNNYTAAGSYAVTLITSGGCDSVATLNLVVNTTVTSTTNMTICNNQLPFSWNGNSYPIQGIYPVTLTSSSGCDSIATLNLAVTDILTSTTNVTVCNTSLPYIWNGNSYPAGGTYSVTLTTPAGCDSVPILSLTVVPYVTSTTPDHDL